jgi:hypothetical protein
MAQSLPTNTGVITAGLLRAAVALQVGVYEFKDGNIDDTEAMKGIESAAKEIERLVRALRKTF